LISSAVRTSLSRTPLHRVFGGGTAYDQFRRDELRRLGILEIGMWNIELGI